MSGDSVTNVRSKSPGIWSRWYEDKKMQGVISAKTLVSDVKVQWMKRDLDVC
jgi:hypothetical protein